MNITDVHAHLYSPDWYPQKFQNQLAVEYFARKRKNTQEGFLDEQIARLNYVLKDPDGSLTLRLMDKLGITRRVVHIIDWGLELGEPSASIRDIHRLILRVCARYPDRLVGFAGVDPRRHDALDLLAWAFDDLGAAGLKLHPTSRSWTLFDEPVRKMLDMVERRRLPVMVHTGKTVSILSDLNCQPSSIVQLAVQFPSISFIAGHSAFSAWRRFQSSGPVPSNLFFDISGWQDQLAENREGLKTEIESILRTFRNRVFYGTDSPFYGYNIFSSESLWIEFLQECTESLDEQAKHAFFSCHLF